METPHNGTYFDNDGGVYTEVFPGPNRLAQHTALEPSGYTLASFVRGSDLWVQSSACQRLKRRATFQAFDKRPHITHQSILGARQPALSAAQRRQVVEAASLTARLVFGAEEPLRLRLDKIQIGRTDGYADGTVVWLASRSLNARPMQLAENYRQALAPQLARIDPALTLAPGQPGGKWMTLGFFDEIDNFAVDRELSDAFHELSASAADVWLDQVSLMEFTYKSLEDGRVLDTIPLCVMGPCSAKRFPTPRVVPQPVWAELKGWSFIFDNPGDSLRPLRSLRVMACRPWNDPKLALYRLLVDALDAIGLHTACNPYTLFRVEAVSKHVTVLDGDNEENLGDLSAAAQAGAAAFLKALPGSIASPPPELIDQRGFDGIISPARPLRLKFDRLSKFGGNKVLVARLQPADDDSARLLKEVTHRRAELDQRFVSQGRKPLGEYKPHCTLGYFSNEEAADRTKTHMNAWTDLFRQIAGDTCIEFTGISAYGFTDMKTFVKR